MAERFGNVIYWIGCCFAALIVVGAFPLAATDNRPEMHTTEIAVMFGIAFVVWLIGRACRYVLAGR
jgi:hypothetical protein